MGRISKEPFRIAFIVTLFLGIFGFVALPLHAFQNEPDGFRGLTWGASINSVAGKIEEREERGGQFLLVTFKNEKLTLGGAELSSIQYLFKSGGLFSVYVRAEKPANFTALKNYFSSKHGLGSQSDKPDKRTESYQWKGDVTSIKLFYLPEREQVFLEIASTRAAKSLAEEIQKGTKDEW